MRDVNRLGWHMTAPVRDFQSDRNPAVVWLPGRLWSLWDMFRLKASELTRALTAVAAISTLIKERGSKDIVLPKDEKETAQLLVDELIGSVVAIGMPLTVKSIGRLKDRLDQEGTTYRELQDAYYEIEMRIHDELDLVTILCLDKRMADYYEPVLPAFGQEVESRFPSANYEIEEAGKCLALRRSTACVAHLMRALEPGLNSLAAALNVPFERANWQNILDQIDATVRAIGVGRGPHPAGWREDQRFYSEAASHLRLIKDAWRNHTMHLGDRYDEERAEAIFNNVKSAMKHLATRLSEPSVDW